ncbi:hypothetical protein ACHZ98_35070 [Streptomyces sp. MAR4 CNY-716]
MRRRRNHHEPRTIGHRPPHGDYTRLFAADATGLLLLRMADEYDTWTQLKGVPETGGLASSVIDPAVFT